MGPPIQTARSFTGVKPSGAIFNEEFSPRIGVGVSAPGAQSEQKSPILRVSKFLTHVSQIGLKVVRTQSPPLELKSPPARTEKSTRLPLNPRRRVSQFQTWDFNPTSLRLRGLCSQRESLSTREGGFLNSRRGFSTQSLFRKRAGLRFPDCSRRDELQHMNVLRFAPDPFGISPVSAIG